MRTIILSLMILGFASQAGAYELTCKNKDFEISEWKYDGGAHPYNGMVMQTTKVTLAGEVIDSFQYIYGSADTHVTKIEITFDDRNQKIVTITDPGNGSGIQTLVYEIPVKVVAVMGQTLPTGGTEYKGIVTCHEEIVTTHRP